MTEKKDYFSELEKVAEKLLFPYEIKFKNIKWHEVCFTKEISINSTDDKFEWKNILWDFVQSFAIFFENHLDVIKGNNVDKSLIYENWTEKYFNYLSKKANFWYFWTEFELISVKCYKKWEVEVFNTDKSKKQNKDWFIKDENTNYINEIYKCVPFFIDQSNILISENFDIIWYSPKKEKEKNKIKIENTNRIKLQNSIWKNILQNSSWKISFFIHPLKSNFHNEIEQVKKEINNELNWSLNTNNLNNKWWTSDIIESYNTNQIIDNKINKIIKLINIIQKNPHKDRKKVLLQDFSKQKLDRSFWKNIIKNQKFLEENDKEYENGYFKTKDNELNIKNVKQYWYIDDYNTKLNKYIKSNLYNYILIWRINWVYEINKLNPYLNEGIFKNVDLSLSEVIPNSIQQYSDYYELFKLLDVSYELDLYWLETKLDINTYDNWYEYFCMIKLKQILSSYKAKELWFKIIDNNLSKNLIDWDKIKKEDDWSESRVNFRRWEYELHLTFWSCLLKVDKLVFDNNKNIINIIDKNSKSIYDSGFNFNGCIYTPDYTIEIYKQWVYQWMIILDAKYSLQYYKDYNLFWPKFDLLEELRNKYFIKDSYIVEYKDRKKFFDDKKNKLNLLTPSKVKKVILLYPWKFDWNFKIHFKKYEEYNDKLLQTWVWIFPVNIWDLINFDEYFLKTIINIFES